MINIFGNIYFTPENKDKVKKFELNEIYFQIDTNGKLARNVMQNTSNLKICVTW